MLIKENKNMTASERAAVANTNNSYLQALSYVAVGTIFPFAGEQAPDTFMLCNGAELDTEESPELFNVIGYTFGGSENRFHLPDLRGRVLVGLDASKEDFKLIGKQGGESKHALTEEEGPMHSHMPTDKLQGGSPYVFQTARKYDTDSTGRFLVKQDNTGTYYVAGANTKAADYVDMNDIDGELQTASSGQGTAHNNLQPYTVCNYIIKVTNRLPNILSCEYVLSESDKTDIANLVLANFTDVSEVGR